jgi:hypothetical protein
MRDKKAGIRTDAMVGLAKLYNLAHAAWDPRDGVDSGKSPKKGGGKGGKKAAAAAAAPAQASKWSKDRKKCFESIPSKILHCFVIIPDAEDKFRIERILNEELIPKNLESEERATKLAIMVSALDSHAHDAFVRLLKDKKAFRDDFRHFLNLSAAGADKDALQRRMASLKQRLPVMPGQDKFDKMVKLNDEALMKSFAVLVNPKANDKQVAAARDSIDRRYGQPGKKTNLGEYIMTIVQKLSATLIGSSEYHIPCFPHFQTCWADCSIRLGLPATDKEGVGHVIEHLVTTLEDDADDIASVNPLLTLLEDLSECYPSFFAGAALSSLADLLDRNNKRQDVLDKVLHILANVGSFVRDEANSDTHSSLKKPLAALCLKGTAKQAKLAVSAIHQMYTDEKSIFNKIVKELVTKMSMDELETTNNGPSRLATVLSSLKTIAKVFPSALTNEVSRLVGFVVDELLPATSSSKKGGSGSLATAAKLEGLKAVANALMSHHDHKDVVPKQVKVFLDEAFETLDTGDHPSAKSGSTYVFSRKPPSP